MSTEPTAEPAAGHTTPPGRKLISKAELLELLPISFPTIWELMRRGKFPLSIRLGDSPQAKAGWFLDEVTDWQESRPRTTLKPLTEAEAQAAEATPQ